MKIICIAGKARHGKDTAAEYLKKKFEEENKRVLIVHYADLLKYICKTFLGWDGKKDERGRELLQYVGTDIIRKHRPDYWVDFVVDILKLFKDYWIIDYIVIPDCRFPNEIQRMKENGFDTVSLQIIRDNFESELTAEQMQHASETALDNFDFDYTIHNSTMVEFFKNLDRFADVSKLDSENSMYKSQV